MFTLYSADFIGNPGNCSYPHKTVVMDEDSLKAAVGHDYVCAEYKHHYRNGENFLSADCLPVDCDNDHSEDPKKWVTPADVLEAFPGASIAIHYSRFNQRDKNGKPARPKFHVLFPIERVTDATLYSDMKKLVNSIFPYFDTNALDAARFFFGTQEPNVELYPGRMNLTEFLNDDEFDAGLPGSHEKDVTISEGSRNSTMSRFAGIVIKKYGDMEKAATCVPPLDQNELDTIWHSAQRFYSKISREDGYVPPEVYNDENSYMPEDISEVGQAEVLSKYFANELRYSPATHFIRYSDHYWQETEPGAQAVAHELTCRQLVESNRMMLEALQKIKNCGAQEILDNTSKAKAEQLMNDEQMKAYQEFLAAKAYQSFAVRRRDSKNITSTLKETHPMLEISPRDLDADCFLHSCTGYKYAAWCCNTHIEDKNRCHMLFVKDEMLNVAFITMMNKLIFSHRMILKPYLEAIKNISTDDSLRRIQQIQTLLAQNTEKRETLTKLLTQGIIDPVLYSQETNELLSQADSFRDEIEALKNAVSGDVTKVTETTALIHFAEKSAMLHEFDDDLFDRFVKRIVVHSRNDIRFELKCGLTLRERK